MTNNSSGTVTVQTIGSIQDRSPGIAPFSPNISLLCGTSADNKFLAASRIFAQSQLQMSEDGVFVKASAEGGHAFGTVG